jgi:hypothetical protein
MNARRRHPGVYVFRTRKHSGWGTEWGYAGKSNHLALRKLQHADKPWSDLVVYYWAFELPWWLGWQWITLSLETLVIVVLRPRYNWQKNPRRSKVGPRGQQLQRAARDRVRSATITRTRVTPSWSPALWLARWAGIALAVTGLFGYVIATR